MLGLFGTFEDALKKTPLPKEEDTLAFLVRTEAAEHRMRGTFPDPQPYLCLLADGTDLGRPGK